MSSEKSFWVGLAKQNFMTGFWVGMIIVIGAGMIMALVFFSRNSYAGSSQQQIVEEPKENDAPDENIVQSERPDMKFFVMSFCPYGKQAENGIGPVAKILGEESNIEPHYVIYSNYCGRKKKCSSVDLAQYCLEDGKYCSMHGLGELNENVRQLCVWQEYGQYKYWDYVNQINASCDYRNVDSCWKGQAQKLDIDPKRIETCFTNDGLAMLENESALNKKYKVRGSPQVFINDQPYQSGRAPENYKQALCSAFNEQPEECDQILGAVAGVASGGCE